MHLHKFCRPLSSSASLCDISIISSSFLGKDEREVLQLTSLFDKQIVRPKISRRAQLCRRRKREQGKYMGQEMRTIGVNLVSSSRPSETMWEEKEKAGICAHLFVIVQATDGKILTWYCHDRHSRPFIVIEYCKLCHHSRCNRCNS